MTLTTVIRGATVLTMDDSLGDLVGADILVRDGRIAAVGTGLSAPADAAVVDGRGRIVIPGFVDTHRHMYQAVLRGMAPAHTLGDYFSDVLGVVAPRLTPDDLRVGEMLSARASLASGITTVQDISNIQDTPAHTDAIVDALRRSGLRAVFGYGLTISGVTAGGRLPDDVVRVRRDLLPDDDARVTMSVVAEASDDAVERANADLARDLGLRVARHVSRDQPVKRLAALGALVPGTTFIHANGLTTRDLAAIAASRSSVSVAPAIEMTMGHGFPMAARLPLDILLTVSTDVEVTVAADMFTQMRALYASARTDELILGDVVRRVTVRDVLRAATRNGAESLGLGSRVGTISPGKAADLVVLRADRADVAPIIDPVSTVVLQMDRSHIESMMVEGRAVTTPDDDLLDRAARTVARLRAAHLIPA